MLDLTRKTTRYAGGGVIKRHMMPDHVHMLRSHPTYLKYAHDLAINNWSVN